MSPRCKLSAGFCLLTAWFGAVNGWELLGLVLLAAAVHEMGHVVTLLSLGGRVTGFRVGVLGAVLETDSRRLTYGGEILTALAGPGSNLLAGWLLSRTGLSTAAGAHLVLGAFNLLPLWPLDGGRVLGLAVCWAWGPGVGYIVLRWCGMVTAAVLAVGLCGLMWCTGGSLWLVPAAWGILTAGIGSFLGNLQE